MATIKICLDLPDRFTKEEIFAVLDRIQDATTKALPEIDPLNEMVTFNADWEDDEGINCWSP